MVFISAPRRRESWTHVVVQEVQVVPLGLLHLRVVYHVGRHDDFVSCWRLKQQKRLSRLLSRPLWLRPTADCRGAFAPLRAACGHSVTAHWLAGHALFSIDGGETSRWPIGAAETLLATPPSRTRAKTSRKRRREEDCCDVM